MGRLVINQVRKLNTRYQLFDRVAEVMRPHTPNPEQEYEAREQQQLVLEMLQGLPDINALVVKLV